MEIAAGLIGEVRLRRQAVDILSGFALPVQQSLPIAVAGTYPCAVARHQVVIVRIQRPASPQNTHTVRPIGHQDVVAQRGRRTARQPDLIAADRHRIVSQGDGQAVAHGDAVACVSVYDHPFNRHCPAVVHRDVGVFKISAGNRNVGASRQGNAPTVYPEIAELLLGARNIHTSIGKGARFELRPHSLQGSMSPSEKDVAHHDVISFQCHDRCRGSVRGTIENRSRRIGATNDVDRQGRLTGVRCAYSHERVSVHGIDTRIYEDDVPAFHVQCIQEAGQGGFRRRRKEPQIGIVADGAGVHVAVGGGVIHIVSKRNVAQSEV